jgi:hypothetical protein
MGRPSSWSLVTRRDGPFWAAERKMTGKAVAYLIALYRGRRLELSGKEYSIKHWRKRKRYGKLSDQIKRQFTLSLGGITDLMIVGKTHLCQPSSGGAARRVFPGSNMSVVSQKSPKTLAKEVAMSANTMSENSIGKWEGGKMHRPSALQTSDKRLTNIM